MKYNIIRQNRYTAHISKYEFFQYIYPPISLPSPQSIVFLVYERDERGFGICLYECV